MTSNGAIREMKRLLRQGGKLILVDHIRSDVRPFYWLQKLIEFFSLRLEGEHMTRRPAGYVEREGFEIKERERLGAAGVIERLIGINR